MAQNPQTKAAEKAQLLARCRLTVAAIEKAELSPLWDQLRATVEASASRIGDLRSIARELMPMVATLPSQIRMDLAQQLSAHGIDLQQERERETAEIAEIRTRGLIRSEAEYRRVQAYADTLVQPEEQAEFLALGTLLDAFMAAPDASRR